MPEAAILAVISGLLFLLFVYVAVFNWGVIILGLVTRKRQPSLGPILGGLAGAAAFLIFPYYPLRRYAWVPLLVDPGCLPYLLIGCVEMGKQLYETSPFFRVARFRSVGYPEVSVRLMLYRPSLCIIRKDIASPSSKIVYPQLVSMSRVGHWSIDGNELTIDLGDTVISYEFLGTGEELARPTLRWVSSSASTLFDGIDLQVVGNTRIPIADAHS